MIPGKGTLPGGPDWKNIRIPCRSWDDHGKGHPTYLVDPTGKILGYLAIPGMIPGKGTLPGRFGVGGGGAGGGGGGGEG